jgi:hypothetical protein
VSHDGGRYENGFENICPVYTSEYGIALLNFPWMITSKSRFLELWREER